jgi:hypothetical protein
MGSMFKNPYKNFHSPRQEKKKKTIYNELQMELSISQPRTDRSS